MKNLAKLNAKFEKLNKLYIATDKKMSLIASKGKDTFDVECKLENIQSEMSLVSNEIEKLS